MAYPVYSKQLYIAHGITAGSFVIEDGFVAVIRCISCYVGGIDVVATFTLTDNETGTVLFYAEGDILSGGVSMFAPDVRIVIPPGKIIDVSVFAEGSPNGDVALYGYLLTLP